MVVVIVVYFVVVVVYFVTYYYSFRHGLKRMELFYLLNVVSLVSVVGFAGWLVVFVFRTSSHAPPVSIPQEIFPCVWKLTNLHLHVHVNIL